MWYHTPPRKPLYRRPWFVISAGFLLTLLLAAAVCGLVAKSKWERLAREFDYGKLSEMGSASIIYDRNGGVLGRLFIQNRDEVPLSEFAPALLTAVIAAEDARFYEHKGVDFTGVLRAAVKNLQAGRKREGASTVTQQLARNTFPKELPSNDRSYHRKLLEMAVALEIERRCNKNKILELYLNRVFFGSGFYGAEAAARGYFGKNARDLTLSEAATLAGLLRSPSHFSPWRSSEACLKERNRVLQRAFEEQLITKAEYERTIKEDIIVKNRRPIHQDSYAADLVAQQVEKLVGREAAHSDGYRIHTTIDADLQKKAEAALRERLGAVERRAGYEHPTYEQYDELFRAHARRVTSPDDQSDPLAAPEYLQGSILALDNRSGGILVLVGGRDFKHSEYDRAISARRPPGTAFKPLVYAAAFEKGLFPGTAVQDAVFDNRQVMIGGLTGILGEWGPERVDNRYEGTISAREALVKSKNAATVRIGMTTGLGQLTALARRAGIESPLRQYPSTYLGSSELTLSELTLANTIFPRGGHRPARPFIINRIEDKDGRVIFQAETEAAPVVKPAVAYEVHSCLAEVLDRGTADKAFTELGLKRFPLGGKTGTAYNFTDLWFVGYSSEVTAGVWVGFDKPRTIYRGAFSNEIALPVWTEVIAASFKNYRPQEIGQPKGVVKCEICTASGLLATDKCVETAQNKDTGETVQRRTTSFEIAAEETVPRQPCNVHGPATPTLVKSISGTEWPRAALAVDVSSKTPIAMKAPTVLGEDPYNSVQALNNMLTAKALAGQVAPMESAARVPAPAPEPGEQMQVRRAEAVRPVDAMTVDESTIKLEPPAPIEF
ncbi:MAG: transglycosylase domain-containing protein [Verrucomicrobiota bacterium]|nr:transglycosylase domain-containing protein [Verrucomicrobiota bacterium]